MGLSGLRVNPEKSPAFMPGSRGVDSQATTWTLTGRLSIRPRPSPAVTLIVYEPGRRFQEKKREVPVRAGPPKDAKLTIPT